MTEISFDGPGILTLVAGTIIAAAIIAGFGYLSRKFRCIDTVKSDIGDVKNEIKNVKGMVKRQSTTIVTTSYRQDEITASLHPDSPIKSNLGPLAENLLKEDID